MKSIQKPSEIKPTLISCRLEQVPRLHPVIESICEELEIPLIGVSIKATSAYPGLLDTLARTPIFVMRGKHTYFCTGNVRAFLMAQALLPPESTISCIEFSEATTEAIRKDFLCEFIYQPAIFGVQSVGVDVIAQVGRLAFGRAYLDRPPISVETHFSNLYRVDRRTLTPKPMVTQEELNQANNFWDESSRAPGNDID
jgi:hypothetical protein